MELSENSHDKIASYDRFFKENYGTLQRWALQITMYDRELAEDLVHDIYIRFSRREKSPGEVDSVHGYLYVALKNAYISHLRTKTKTSSRQLSLLDHDFADNLWLMVDPRSTFKVHDDLREICEFACNRKRTSMSASILILRFFHGYFSSEVARIVKRSRNAVEARLLKARSEVRLHLAVTPNRKNEEARRDYSSSRPIIAKNDLLLEIRERVYAAVEGRCLPPENLYAFYTESNMRLTRGELSHLVSCRKCLNMVNDLLRMPQLGERHPLDTLGRQTVVDTLQYGLSRAASVS